nr:MAG TPA: hypothetical protein [Caudoviricetes sp.]
MQQVAADGRFRLGCKPLLIRPEKTLEVLIVQACGKAAQRLGRVSLLGAHGAGHPGHAPRGTSHDVVILIVDLGSRGVIGFGESGDIRQGVDCREEACELLQGEAPTRGIERVLD